MSELENLRSLLYIAIENDWEEDILQISRVLDRVILREMKIINEKRIVEL